MCNLYEVENCNSLKGVKDIAVIASKLEIYCHRSVEPM